jgi:hypothetical protein
MKCFIAFVFLFFSNHLYSQEVEKAIILKDADTNLAIEDATVLVLKTKQMNLTNVDGKVSFLIKGASNIQISHTAYTTLIIRSSQLKEAETVVFLKSTVNNLEEIIVTKQHPQKILTNIIENSIKKLTIPARLKIYSREFFKLNGNYTYYNDGLMNFQLFGKPKNLTSTILVEQNRAYGLYDDSVSEDLLGYNLNDLIENYYNFKYLLPLTESRAKKEYDFLIKANLVNEDYYIMIVKPQDGNKSLLDDFTITYDKKKKIIIEVIAEIAPSTFAKTKDHTGKKVKNLYKSFFKALYGVEASNYYLVSSREEIGFERIFKNKSTDIEVKNSFITTNFSNQNYVYKDSEVFKGKSLINKTNVILNNYWEISGLIATEEEEQIIKSLED